MFLQLTGVLTWAIFSLPLARYHKYCKNQVQQEEALTVAPFWSNEPCFSQVLSLAAQEPLIYKPTATNLILPQDPKVKHPLAEKLSLMVQ